MKVALVYDRINKWGGAERVLLALHKLFPNAPIYTSVYDEESAPWAARMQVIPSFLQKIPFAKKNHEVFAPFMPYAFESFNFSAFDVVISVTSEAAKGIITKPHTQHICICLTPTRYLWSGYTVYFGDIFSKLFYLPIVSYLKKWDTVAASRPDYYIAISNTVRDRIKKYYHRDSTVIYPGITLASNIRNDPKYADRSRINPKSEPYFLVVSRLSKFTMYKRVDLAIRAANRLKIQLKIIGQGRDIEYFKELSGPTVEFLGKVTDDQLSEYYNHARALLFPGEEDFGLVMVEAQAHGLPVIAYRAGGATEIVIDGKTGLFFEKPTISSLSDAIERFAHKRFKPEICIENAKRFTVKKFGMNITKFVDKAIKDKVRL